MKRIILLYGVMALCLAGCGAKTKYAWNGYDDTLYQHYKNPAEYENFAAKLKEAVEEATASGNVPPGMYAEYGYVLFEQGSTGEAARYFRMESDKWPESRVLMAKLIKLAEADGKKKSNAAAESPVAAAAEPNTPPSAAGSVQTEVAK